MPAILAVDDSKVIIKQYERFTSEFFPTYTFLSANSGAEAIELLNTNKEEIFFAIIDYNMSEMDGIELVQNIKDKIDPSKIVICSANLQKALQEKVNELKIGFVPKPVSADKYKQIIEMVGANKI